MRVGAKNKSPYCRNNCYSKTDKNLDYIACGKDDSKQTKYTCESVECGNGLLLVHTDAEKAVMNVSLVSVEGTLTVTYSSD